MSKQPTSGLIWPLSLKHGERTLACVAFLLGTTTLMGQGTSYKGFGPMDNLLLNSTTYPWFRSNGAFLFYGLLVLGTLFYAFFQHRRYLNQQQQFQQEKKKASHSLKLAAEENKNLQRQFLLLENGQENVKKQLRSKTIELVKKTKENDEKGRILRTVKEEVDEITKQNESTKFQWRKVSRILDQHQEAEDNNFSVLIEELHQDFLSKLNKKHPQLTTYDLRLCVYLKSGLTTREMAKMMNVLPSSVNVSRSRLRKKLMLDPKEDLYKFLKTFE